MIVNSYYFARILSLGHGNKRNIIDKLGVFFPKQNNSGVMVNISGAAVTKTQKQKKYYNFAEIFSKQAQELYAKKIKNILLLKVLKPPTY